MREVDHLAVAALNKEKISLATALTDKEGSTKLLYDRILELDKRARASQERLLKTFTFLLAVAAAFQGVATWSTAEVSSLVRILGAAALIGAAILYIILFSSQLQQKSMDTQPFKNLIFNNGEVVKKHVRNGRKLLPAG